MGSPFAAIGAGLQAVQGIAGIFAGARTIKEANKELKTLKPVWNDYQGSQAGKDMAGMTQAQLFSRNGAIARAQRGVTGNLATAMGSINRNSRDASTDIAATVGALSQANANMGDIADKQFAMDQNAMNNWMRAQDVLVGEDKVKNENMIAKYQFDMKRKSELEGMKNAGRQTMLNSLGKMSEAGFNAGMMRNKSASPLPFSGGGVNSFYRSGNQFTRPVSTYYDYPNIPGE